MSYWPDRPQTRQIRPDMRRTVLTWLEKIVLHFKLERVTFSSACHVFDTLLWTCSKSITRQNLQTVGSLCLLLSSNLHDQEPVNAEESVFAADNAFSQKELYKEMKHHLSLNVIWALGEPCAWTFLLPEQQTEDQWSKYVAFQTDAVSCGKSPAHVAAEFSVSPVSPSPDSPDSPLYSFSTPLTWSWCADLKQNLHHSIGHGSYGKVYQGQGVRQACAIKHLYGNSRDRSNMEILPSMIRELVCMSRVCPQQISEWYVEISDVETHLYFASALAETDLRQVSPKLINQWTQQQRIHITYDLLCQLRRAHKAGWTHRDLVPSNIVLSDIEKARPCATIIDWGMSRCHCEHITEFSPEIVTMPYRPPEYLLLSPDTLAQGTHIDIWTLGACLCIIWGFHDPLWKTPEPEVIYFFYCQNLKHTQDRQKFFAHITDAHARDLISHMMRWQPAKRWSVEQCLSHPLFDQ